MKIVDSIKSSIGASRAAFTGMSAAGRAAWTSAETVADLRALTIKWLKGDLGELPYYRHGCDVDEKIAPGLTDALIALNGNGFLTVGSQAGFTSGDGKFSQRATVHGFCDTATWMRLEHVLRGRGVGIADAQPYEHAQITSRAGDESTGFVDFVRESPRRLRDPWLGFGLCCADVVDELLGMHQLVITADELGTNDMWQVTSEALAK